MVKSTIEGLLKDGISIIQKREYNNPLLEAQLILSYLLKCDKIYLHINKDKEVDGTITKLYYGMVEKRNSGYPLQYITNQQEFMGLDFYIQEGVLVPRPDTEILVEKIINIVNKKEIKNKEIKILDIGTGSGAIAIALAYYLKNSQVTAVDISQIAMQTTEINIKKHNLKNIETVYWDIFNEHDIKIEKFDIVVSNPPYIKKNVIKELPLEVSNFEPKIALDGGDDGLCFYRQIVKVFKEISLSNSILSVEIGFDQKQEVKEIFENTGLFKRIETDKDFSGNHRVVTGFL